MEKWDGTKWAFVAAYGGLNQKRWTQRPMMGGTQWRVMNLDRSLYSWGIKELKMYSIPRNKIFAFKK